MATYNIKHTDINKTPIIVDQGALDVTSTDVALFGHIKQEYGELLNENLLHILENFACPEDPANPGNPDLDVALSDTLSHPSDGKVWYNSTQEVPFVWDEIEVAWVAVGSSADFAANSGKILHNQQLPLPVSPSGYQFTYRECIWIVSPSGVQQTAIGNNGFSYMVCTTDKNGLVNHQYAIAGTNVLVAAVANYMIIGMKNSNPVADPNPHHHNYESVPPPPAPPININPVSFTPTPTPAAGVSPTPTPTRAATITPTLTVTPTLTITPTQTRAPTVTPTASPLVPITAVIYINPSVGYSQAFGSGQSFLPICSTGPTNSCKQALGVVVANIIGGIGGLYTIRYNLNIFYSVINVSTNSPASAAPVTYNPTTGVTYVGSPSGYNVSLTGTTSNVSAGNGVKDNAFVAANYTVISDPATVQFTILAGSSITISDSAGNSTKYYTPGGSAGQVSGTSLTTIPSSNYSDSYLIAVKTTSGGPVIHPSPL